jgi:hypothetical protein
MTKRTKVKVVKITRGRDSKTGQFIPIKTAKKRKATATVDNMKRIIID